MTSIKPPGEGVSVDRAQAQNASVEGLDRAGPSFREVLGPEGGTGVASAQDVGAARVAADPTALAEALGAGTLTREQALDRLVERVVAQSGSQLTAPQQAELRSVLLQALDSDPSLRELQDDLS